MRLVDADALKEALSIFNDGDPHFLNGIKTAREIIDNAPTIDAEPVRHGTWMTCEDNWGDIHYQCSECGCEWSLDDGTPEENGMRYCPSCGAKMGDSI